ncbi:hypothetical protein [Mycobacteroides salmoniphilum]|uniref:hypothetical protein n=1 Tax=Mycobacteroides salmoniphilum TaxID=404941 RepID=UPI001064D1FE|nr:hypothetical protein [Mycobacteroides salmoniphilum]TDZ80957.1 hypothetical protein DE4586_00901 [Mycobacteroides salmoniphilum]TDZ88457.1 hypothetical protein DE4587_00817 [Mycobacteroides salmoniphilum]
MFISEKTSSVAKWIGTIGASVIVVSVMAGCSQGGTDTPNTPSTSTVTSTPTVPSPAVQRSEKVVNKSQLRGQTLAKAKELLNSGSWKPHIYYGYEGNTDAIKRDKDDVFYDTKRGETPEYDNFVVKAVCFYTVKPRQVMVEITRPEWVDEKTRQRIMAGEYESSYPYDDGDNNPCDLSVTSIDLGIEPPVNGPKPPYPPQLVKMSDLVLKTRAEMMEKLKSGRWWPTVLFQAAVTGSLDDAAKKSDLNGSGWDDAIITDVCFVKGKNREVSVTMRPADQMTPEIEEKVRKQAEKVDNEGSEACKSSIDLGNIPPSGP